MSLDAMTVRGSKFLGHARDGVETYIKATGYMLLPFPDEFPADVDGVIVSPEGCVVSLYEIKARNMTLEDLRGKYANEWLVSYDKLQRGYSLAKSLCTSLTGFLYLIPDKILLEQSIWDRGCGAGARFRIEQTRTRKSCNGGSAVRPNAYIDMSAAVVYRKTVDAEVLGVF